MLWTKPWRPDAVLLLVGAAVVSLFTGNLAVQALHQFKVAGFQTMDDAGSIIVATLCFHGTVIAAAFVFLKLHDITWCDALGLHGDAWKNHLKLAVVTLVVILPVMFGLKYISTILMLKMGLRVDDQAAVEMFSGIKSVWLGVYFGFFTVVLAPLAEEFFFRGLLFSAAKKIGKPGLGWIGVSFLFAFIHFNAPIFLPLFVLALALTWLYEKTGGLFAPIVTHSLFNALNLGFLLVAQIHSPAPS